MFGLLYTGDSYKSQTENLVLCTRTYLKLCYRNAIEIYDLAGQKKDLLAFWIINRNRGISPLNNLDKRKNTEKPEDRIQALCDELLVHSMTTKLYASFSLESFINSFAVFMTNKNILVNVPGEAKEVILYCVSRLYDKMSTLDKWDEVANQFGQSKINKYTLLWKKFCNLYSYRDDVVHDKPIFICRTGDILKVKKGMIKTIRKEESEPDLITYYINDAYQACKTHDDMIRKLHVITGVTGESDRQDFFVLPKNYHRKIKNVIKRLEELEKEIGNKENTL